MSRKTDSLTADRLREVLHYDPDTGIFTWRMSLNARGPAGRVAGCQRKDCYISIRVDTVRYLGHRLAWLYVHGVFPTGDTDHINGNRSDNRIANLRDVTRLTNRQNLRRAIPGSATGLLGVSTARGGKYRATIRVHGRQTYIGTFGTPEEAHAAYVVAKRKFHAGCTL